MNMCGIFGFSNLKPDNARLKRMASVAEHRGPDDEGLFEHGDAGIGFRRLSIIDVSGGHQPIFNEDKTVLVVANGEIYNYRELTADLKRRGHKFSTNSDAEVIVHLYEEKGIDCVDHLRGMFAFAVYDLKEKKLMLARDRSGIKPLYYWAKNGGITFASEIKSLLECTEISREPHLPSVDHYLSLRYVPGPETMFSGIRKLAAGHRLIWKNKELKLERYWAPAPGRLTYQADEYYRERFAELFRESIQMRLMSDVPLGAYLSGGIDSSAIVATMSRMMNQPVKTFSVGFAWHGDELPAAREVANAIGSEHHEIICGEKDLGLLPKIVWHLDEPIGDGIVLPMYLLSRLARKHVSVVLTGEGADETLAGYLPHKVMYWARQYANSVPKGIQNRLVQPLVKCVPNQVLNLAFSYPGALGERGKRKVLDYLSLVGDKRARDEYYFLISLFDKRDKTDLYTSRLKPGAATTSNGHDALDEGAPYLDQILSLQYENWLPDDILMKQDKMTMANSIEGRVPFLDHPLVEFLHETPPHLKLQGLVDKALLRDYLKRLHLADVARRPKKPFYIPMDQYFGNGPLHEIVETCLSEKSVKKRGYFEWNEVKRLKESMGGDEFLYGKQVLSLVMLELWHRIFIDQESGWVTK